MEKFFIPEGTEIYIDRVTIDNSSIFCHTCPIATKMIELFSGKIASAETFQGYTKFYLPEVNKAPLEYIKYSHGPSLQKWILNHDKIVSWDVQFTDEVSNENFISPGKRFVSEITLKTIKTGNNDLMFEII